MRRDAPSFDVAPVRPPGQRGAPAVAAALALALAVGVGLALYERTRNAISGASPAPSATSSSAVGTRAARASPPPRLLVPGDPVTIPPLLVRADGPRLLDLTTGTLGGPLSRDPLDEWFQVAEGGELLCLCRTATRDDDGHHSVTLSIVRAVATGRRLSTAQLWSGRALPRPAEERAPVGAGVTAHAALAPDGGTLLAGIADLGRDGWRARVLVSTLDGRPSYELAVPLGLAGSGADPSAVDVRIEAVAGDAHGVRAIATLSIDAPDVGRQAHVELVVRDGRASLVRHWSDDPADASRRCTAAAGPFLVEGDPVEVCLRAAPPGLVALRRFDDDADAPSDTSLGLDGGTLELGEWRQVGHRLVHWNPFARHLAVVDSTAAVISERDEAPLSSTRAFQSALLGPTLAIDPARQLAFTLAADPTTVSPSRARSQMGPAEPPRTVGVYSLADTGPLRYWDAPPAASSIALTADGRYVLVAVAPSDAEPYPNAYAGVIAYDSETGEVRLVAGRLGEAPIRFAPRGWERAFVGD